MHINNMAHTKKKYDLPGQRKDTPLPSDPLYRFYTSLLIQRPKSRMALQWCLERGLLSARKAEKVALMFEMEKLSLKESKSKSKDKDKESKSSKSKSKA